MSIDIEKLPKKIRRGEAGTIVLKLPQTKSLKILRIELPDGVTSTSGNVITLAPDLTHINIPILVGKNAKQGKVKFSMSEKMTGKIQPNELLADHNLNIDE
ncbi:MAG: hypothetical protein ABSA79_05050 [Candidatus Bathyarchaeia archaeon]|jgi:hypothetical protein